MDRIDFIKNQFKGKLDIYHDSFAEHKTEDKIVEHFAATGDPTPKKVYTSWILNQYATKVIRQEDSSRINATLALFDKVKSRLEVRDINKYKTLSELEDSIEPFAEVKSNKEIKRGIKSEGADLVYEDKNMSIYKLKNKEAAQLYGSNTRWCTAGESNNMFDYYNNKGPLYVIMAGDRKYQIHADTQQFMDEKDAPVKLDSFPDVATALASIENDDNIDKINICFGNNKLSKEKIISIMENDKIEIYRKAQLIIENSAFTSELIEYFLNKKGNHKIIEQAIGFNPHTSEKFRRKLMKSTNAPVREFVMSNENITEGEMWDAIKDPHNAVLKAILYHKNVTPAMVEAAYDHPNYYVKLVVANHTMVSEKVLDRIILDEDFGTSDLTEEQKSDIRETAVRNSKSKERHHIKAIRSQNAVYAMFALENKDITFDAIMEALKSPILSIVQYALVQSSVNDKHIDFSLNHENETIRATAVSRAGASKENVIRGLKDSSVLVPYITLASNKHLTKELIKPLLKHTNTDIAKEAKLLYNRY